MEIISVPKEKKEKVVVFEDLKPGTAFEFENGIKAIKGENDEYFVLTHSSGKDWFVVGDGSLDVVYGVAKIHGKLIGCTVIKND